MRVLLLGARGAVGAVAAAELARLGHEVVPAGRTPPVGGERIDLRAADGLDRVRSVAMRCDAVVNVSGVEDVGLAAAAGSVPFVDISATSSYLDRLVGTATSTPLLVGVGLAPGVSTVMVASLDVVDGDEVDVGIELGAGEHHGAAAVEWTAALVGRPVFDPPESTPVLNLHAHRVLVGAAGRRRRHLRADFPDHVLVGRRKGLEVRSHLCLTSRSATAALELAGRLPGAGALLRHAPHLGSSDWGVVAINRRTGQRRALRGTGQSRATGVLTAAATDRLLRTSAAGDITMADLFTLDEVEAVLS